MKLFLFLAIIFTSLFSTLADTTSTTDNKDTVNGQEFTYGNDVYFYYSGYFFNITDVVGSRKFQPTDLDQIEDLLKRQIFFISTLNLPQEIQDFFQSVPIFITYTMANNYGFYDAYDYDLTNPKSITLASQSLITAESNWTSYKDSPPDPPRLSSRCIS